MRLSAVILAIGFASATSGWARDIYVNNQTGDDRNDGNAPALVGQHMGPYRTIQRALKAATKGDRVILANTGEPYRESITLQGGRHSGLSIAHFELLGNGAVLDGTRPVAASDWRHLQGHVFRFRPPKTSYQMLYLDGKPAVRRDISQPEEITKLKPLEWCVVDHHICFCVEPNRLPQSYQLAYAALQTGVTMYEVRNVTVSDLVIQGFELDGINAHDGVVNARLAGLNCRGNGRSGISIGGASRVTLESCLVGNNGTAQVRTEGFSHTQLVHCDLLDNTAPKIVRDGGNVDISD